LINTIYFWGSMVTLFYRCPDLKCRRMHDGFFYRALVGNLDEGVAVLLRKVKRNSDFDDNLFDKRFTILRFPVFKPLDEGDMFSRNFPLFTKTEHINTGTCPDRCEEVIERGRGGAVSSVFWRLVGCNDESVELGIHSFLARKGYLDFYVSPFSFEMVIRTYLKIPFHHRFAFGCHSRASGIHFLIMLSIYRTETFFDSFTKAFAFFRVFFGPFSLSILIICADATDFNTAPLFF